MPSYIYDYKLTVDLKSHTYIFGDLVLIFQYYLFHKSHDKIATINAISLLRTLEKTYTIKI